MLASRWKDDIEFQKLRVFHFLNWTFSINKFSTKLSEISIKIEESTFDIFRSFSSTNQNSINKKINRQ